MDPITAICNVITAGLTTFNNVWGAMTQGQKEKFVDITLANQEWWANVFNPNTWKNIFTRGKSNT